MVVFKILEALVVSRYLKKPQNTKLQCAEATGYAENPAYAMQTPDTLPRGDSHPECLPKPHTGPCVQVTRRGLGQGIRPREPLSLPLGRPWAADGGQQEPREQATLYSVDSSSPQLLRLSLQ